MALPQVKYLYGQPTAQPQSAFYNALFDGVLAPPTATKIVITAPNGARIVFKGEFTVVGGDVTGGTMTGYTVFAGSTKMENGKGFEIDGAALFDALQNYQMDTGPFFDLFFSDPRKIVGSKQDDYIDGTSGNDKLIGKAGNDSLFGGEGDDILKGGKGNDILDGGEGSNTLVGGKGDDVFHFFLGGVMTLSELGKEASAALAPPIGFSKIKDFKVGEDLIGLSIFDGALPIGFLDKKYFHKGTEATTADHAIIYDNSTGRLYYDVDGNGIEAQILFAKVKPGTKLSADDFFVGGGLLLA